MNKNYVYIGTIAAGVLILVGAAYIFLRPAQTVQTPADFGFGTVGTRTVTVTTEPVPAGGPTSVGIPVTERTVFRIADGPIAGATLIETANPTTTVARYVKQDNGHVFDLPLDLPGAVPRAVSNTTIPGAVRVVWVQKGRGAILQYVNNDTIKSVYLGFQPATTTATTTRPVRIQFLPDNIADLAASPDGSRIAYLLRNASGVAGYLASADGGGSSRLFVLPLSQILLSWPAQNALLLTTKSAGGAAGMAFSVNTASGLVTPLIHAQGLTATADRAFSRIVYQTTPAGATPSTYVRAIATGTNRPLSFDPYPQKCLWSGRATSTMYCATPLEFVPGNYLDLWNLGIASAPDSIFAYHIEEGRTTVLAIPGSSDGGVATDVLELSLAPNEKYLSFIAKADRALWGIRLKTNQ